MASLPDNQPHQRPRYTWPWFVLAAFLLAVALAVLWMSQEIRRTRWIHDANSPSPTNQTAH
jgi:hypothetical protein